MFFRQKPSGTYRYLQLVENYREGRKVRQRTLTTLGRLDLLQASGQMDALMRSGLRFCEKLAVIDAVEKHPGAGVRTVRIGPDLVFGRLWKRLGIESELQGLLEERRYEFEVERAIYLTVLHRLFVSGSDRAAEKWRRGYRIAGTESLELHHLYRAMAWLGEELPAREQEGRTPFSPRCTKDVLEERPLRREVGAQNESRVAGRRGGPEVQAVVDGGRYLPHPEIDSRNPSDLPQVYRDDSGRRLL
jgi:hypothetical protein